MNAEWMAVYTNLGVKATEHHGAAPVLYFVVFDFGRGMISILLYV